jgi:hypothetical protein
VVRFSAVLRVYDLQGTPGLSVYTDGNTAQLCMR